MAKWQGKGLQNPHRRFDSAPRLQNSLAVIRREEFREFLRGHSQRLERKKKNEVRL